MEGGQVAGWTRLILLAWPLYLSPRKSVADGMQSLLAISANHAV